MMKIATKDLSGKALDYAVAIAEGATSEWRSDGPFLWDGIYPARRVGGHDLNYTPSTDWAECGVIIEREGITVGKDATDKPEWSAYYLDSLFDPQEGWHQVAETPLIAAMRCYVLSRLGDEVEVPEELL